MAGLKQAQVDARYATDRTRLEYSLHENELGEITPVVTSDMRQVERRAFCNVLSV